MDTIEMIRLARSGDKLIREQLIKENMGLVYSTARRFSNRGYELDDLYQIGSIGLIKAIDKFDVNYEVRFSTYAVPMIMGEIKRFFRDDGMIKVSRSLKELAMKVGAETERLSAKFGREPTLGEIAESLNVPEENIVVALEAVSEVESLNKTIYQGDGNPISLMDKIEQEKDTQGEIVDRIAIRKVMEGLGQMEQRLIYLRYFMEKTQTDIAKELGISQVQVSRIEKRILKKLRRQMIGNI